MGTREIHKVAVIGSGTMGNQLSEVFARIGGYQVSMVDLNQGLINKGLSAINDRLERFLVSKGKLTADEKRAILSRIRGDTNIESGVTGADFIIEAASENLAIKKDIFSKLDSKASPQAILASNTSFQNISEIASATKRPDKVVGMHFFNPPAVMRLVEVVRTARTSDETVEFVSELAVKLGKEPVTCHDFSYGFLANRAYVAMQKEAVQMLWERVASPHDIDKAIRLGYNLPMGPLELGDSINAWPVWAASEEDSIREIGPEKGRLHPLLKMMMRSGYSSIYQFWEDVLSKW